MGLKVSRRKKIFQPEELKEFKIRDKEEFWEFVNKRNIIVSCGEINLNGLSVKCENPKLAAAMFCLLDTWNLKGEIEIQKVPFGIIYRYEVHGKINNIEIKCNLDEFFEILEILKNISYNGNYYGKNLELYTNLKDIDIISFFKKFDKFKVTIKIIKMKNKIKVFVAPRGVKELIEFSFKQINEINIDEYTLEKLSTISEISDIIKSHKEYDSIKDERFLEKLVNSDISLDILKELKKKLKEKPILIRIGNKKGSKNIVYIPEVNEIELIKVLEELYEF
jgi:hypothetical protein